MPRLDSLRQRRSIWGASCIDIKGCLVILPNGHRQPFALGGGRNGSHDVPSPLHTSDEEDVWIAKCRWRLLGRWVYRRWCLFVAKRRAHALRAGGAATYGLLPALSDQHPGFAQCGSAEYRQRSHVGDRYRRTEPLEFGARASTSLTFCRALHARGCQGSGRRWKLDTASSEHQRCSKQHRKAGEYGLRPVIRRDLCHFMERQKYASL